MKKPLHTIAFILLVIGGLNWGLDLFGVNLVTAIFGSIPLVVKIIYGAIGLSAVYEAYVKLAKK